MLQLIAHAETELHGGINILRDDAADRQAVRAVRVPITRLWARSPSESPGWFMILFLKGQQGK
jgi:hypothetical protein